MSGLFLPGYQNNVFAQIGLVMLIGMAAKNAILIVEFAKLKSEEGVSALDAALSAAKGPISPDPDDGILLHSGCFAVAGGTVVRVPKPAK